MIRIESDSEHSEPNSKDLRKKEENGTDVKVDKKENCKPTQKSFSLYIHCRIAISLYIIVIISYIILIYHMIIPYYVRT